MRTADQNRRAEVAYHTAYSIIPRYITDRDRFQGDFAEAPDLTAIEWYRSAAKLLGRVPDREDLAQVRGHVGRLDNRRDFYLIEYPRFPAVDLMAEMEQGLNPTGGLPAAAGPYVLAPYFSVALIDRDTWEISYFVLGQSPDAHTTIRGVTPDMNANLGPGCEPDRDAFLHLLRTRAARGRA